MELFLKAVFLLLLTGTSAVAKRLNKMATSSETSIVEDLHVQPTPVDAQATREYSPSPVERKRVEFIKGRRGFINRAVKGVKRWVKNKVKKHRQMTAMDEADHFTDHISRFQDDAPQPQDIVREADQYATSDEETESEEEEGEEETAPALENLEQQSPPASQDEKIILAEASLTPAEQAEARWSEASPAAETEAEPEESEVSRPAQAGKESFAHLSTAPLFTVFLTLVAALERAVGK